MTTVQRHFSTYYRGQLAESISSLSCYLRAPHRHPVLLIIGPSFSDLTTLYRALPIAACLRQNEKSAAVAVPQEKVSTAETPARVAHAVRVVPHAAALMGPVQCARSHAFVTVGAADSEAFSATTTSATSATDRGGVVDSCGDMGDMSSAPDKAVPRHDVITSYTDHFCATLRKKRRATLEPWLPNPERDGGCHVAPASLGGCVGLTGEFRTRADRHVGTDASALSTPRVHWVVSRWLSNAHADAADTITAWKDVLANASSSEVASLVLFINSDIVDVDAVLGHSSGACDRTRLPVTPKERNAPLLKRQSCLCRRVQLSPASTMAQALHGAVRQERSPDGVRESGVASAAAGLNGEPTATTAACSAVLAFWLREKRRRRSRSVSAAGAKPRLPHPGAEGRRLVGGLPAPLTAAATKWPEGPARSPQLAHRCRGCGSPAPFYGIDASKTVPFFLVGGAEDQRREEERLLRRNTVDAIALKRLRAAAALSTLRAGGDAASTTAPPPQRHPCPRYYTTMVADAGELLARDGCVSDIFVLELHRELLLSSDYRAYRAWIATTGLAVSPPATKFRLEAQVELMRATEKWMTSPVLSATVTRDLVACAMRLLQESGRSRKVLAWPLIDFTEGCRSPRVAFAVSYELFLHPAAVLRRASTRAAAEGRDGTSAPSSPRAPPSCGPSRQFELEAMADAVRRILARMRRIGWVLVWQEDHHRWPTAVPPPHLHPGLSSVPFNAAPPRQCCSGPQLHTLVASLLQQWRDEQLRVHRRRYDVDRSTASLEHTGTPSAPPWKAAGAAAAPHNSLDFWQAALIPESAGFHLWEGQVVLLADGRCGVVVDFQPPPEGLFVPPEQQPTAALRSRWRAAQAMHADFIRFHLWQQRWSATVVPEHLAAAFTSLPSYVTAREQVCYPVIQLLKDRTARASPLLHVLPRTLARYHVDYPSTCVVTAAEQQRWCREHGRPVSNDRVWRDAAWRVPNRSATGESTSYVTLLRLPLAPFRVDSVASLFLAQAMVRTQYPVRYRLIGGSPELCEHGCFGSKRSQACDEWAELHKLACTSQDQSCETLLRRVHLDRHVHWGSIVTHEGYTAALEWILGFGSGADEEL
ncbi:hypothetical protein NESM_000014000 [Novymonas esmeraldas]|uniref:Uncharacterized protein n=1 Tax=Novymonas esmeraldas TaxID=1808958 RepID=A0AAW0F347_9TRYP